MNEGTSQPLGMDVWAGLGAKSQKPLSEDEWDARLKQLKQFGADEDGLLMRGTEWRKGLAHDREEFRKNTADSLRRALGFKDTETNVALGAAASAGKAATASSL